MAFNSPGEPFSVPDPDGDAYDEMLRRYRLQQAQNDDAPHNLAGSDGDDELVGGAGNDTLSGADRIVDAVERPLGDFLAKDAQGRPLHPVGHPAFGESLIPVVGSGHEALADFQEGHPWLAAGNLGLAGLEAAGIGEVWSDAAKLGLRIGRSQTWNAVRKAALKDGFIDPFQPGHHIVQRQHIPGWVPDRFANNWLNILPMKDQVIDGVAHTGAQVHRRVHGRAVVNGQLMPRFTPLQQLQYGTKSSTRAVLGAVPETLGRATGNWIADQQISSPSPYDPWRGPNFDPP
jgi:hypothetical protein